MWHHICVTWESAKGSWNFYKDGRLNMTGLPLNPGHVIEGGGCLVLGQMWCLQRWKGFVGLLTNVNIWDYTLSKDNITALSQSCLSGIGNVIQWLDFKDGLRGQVKEVTPSTCQPWTLKSFSNILHTRRTENFKTWLEHANLNQRVAWQMFLQRLTSSVSYKSTHARPNEIYLLCTLIWYRSPSTKLKTFWKLFVVIICSLRTWQLIRHSWRLYLNRKTLYQSKRAFHSVHCIMAYSLFLNTAEN